MIARVLFTALLALASMPSAGKAVPAFYPDFLKLSAPLYAEIPDLGKCQTGQLRDSETQALLTSINVIREQHGLGPVSLDKQTEPAVSQAALMFAANGQISHNPPASWRCFTAEGAMAASKSIISGGVAAKNIAFYSPEQDIIAWLTDMNAVNVSDIGHRRLLLDPFLLSVAYGRVSGRINQRKVSAGSALMLKTANNNALGISGEEIIAYPFHDYPTRYFVDGTVLSLSLLIDKTRKQGNFAVDFSNARIRVNTENGSKVQAQHIQYDNKYYGLPNNIQFSLAHVEPGLRYQVSIDNVRVNGTSKSYSYWFRFVPESAPKSFMLQ